MLKQYFKKIIHKTNKNKYKNFVKNLEPCIISSQHNFNHYSNIDLYYNNVIVHKCINLISSSLSQIKWNLYKQEGSKIIKLDQHKLLNLLKKPNGSNNFADILSSVVTQMLLHGNSYLMLEKNHYSKKLELFVIDSQHIEHICSENQIIGYKFLHNAQKKIIYLNDLNNNYSLFHICNNQLSNVTHNFTPLNSILQAANLYSKILDWNQSLLNHSTKPSGTLSFKDGHNLTQDQFDRLKEQFYENFTGASNSGKPLILEGELEWKDLEKHTKLEKFLELKDSLARDIALSFNVPAQLLGIKGDNTYNNMKEARLSFWEDTIMPLSNKILLKLSNWFSGWFEEELILTCDLDAISALNEKRENLWSKVSNANFMTINEKRSIFNLPPIPEGNTLN